MYKEDGVYLANSFTVRTILLCLVTYTVPIVFGAEYVLNKQNVRIAVIGDHGLESTAAKSVAELVTRWDNNGGIDAVVSTGDVNYPRGSRWTIDANVGQYWREVSIRRCRVGVSVVSCVHNLGVMHPRWCFTVLRVVRLYCSCHLLMS